MSQPSKVKVCMIGAGSMASNAHYPSVTQVPGAEVAAVAELIDERAEKAKATWGIPRSYRNYHEMLDKEKPDAVYVIMPPQDIREIVNACLRAKANVFMEKPPGLSTYQIRHWARVARESGVFGMVGFNRRYIPPLQRAKAFVEKHGGPVRLCVSCFYKGNASPNYYDGIMDALRCDAIHAVDYLRFACGGDVSETAHMVSAFGADEPNCWQAMVRFDNGAAGVFKAFWNSGGRQHWFELHAEGASAYIDPDGAGWMLADDGKVREDMDNRRGDQKMNVHYGHLNQAAYFIECVRNCEPPHANFDDAVKTMELVDAIERLETSL